MRSAFILLHILLPVICYGQSNSSAVYIKGEYYEKPLQEFIHEMEKEYGLRFSYTDENVKDVKISGIFRYRTPFADALAELLGATKLSFYFSSDENVVLFHDPQKKTTTTASQQFFRLTGIIKDKAKGFALPFVTIYIPALSKGAVSDDNGLFEIKPVPAGTYRVIFSYVGYRPVTQSVVVEGNTQIFALLEENPVELKEVIVTPGALEISSLEVSPHVLGKEEILQSANFAKDIYRTLRTLPGISSNDFSAKPRIRGGHSEETAIYLDNFQINEPFHLEEIDGTFSIFNTDYIENVKVLPGGFPAKYTDKLSGIIDMTSPDYVDCDKYSFSIDVLNASFLAEKKITNTSNVWVAARRGYLDLLINKFETIDGTDYLRPVFYDVWAKVNLNSNRTHRFSFNFLAGRDDFGLADQSFYLHDKKYNTNAWINWKWFPHKKFQSITTLGYQGLRRNAVFNLIDNVSDNNWDYNDTKSLILTQNNFYDLTSRHSIEFGFELKYFRSAYHYNEIRFNTFNFTSDNVLVDSVFLNSNFNGSTASAYLQYNYRITDALAVQPGIRVSGQTFSKEGNWAPRFAAHYAPLEKLSISIGYGLFYQPDLYYKLRTSLKQATPYTENSKSIHYTGNIQYSTVNTTFQVNAYYKDYRVLYDDFRFEYFNRLGAVSILDIPLGTTEGYSRGVEGMARKQFGKGNSVSISYAHAVNKIRNASGEETFRDFDQTNTIILNSLFRLPLNWNISIFWRYHTGHPYTPMNITFVGDRSSDSVLVPFYEPGKKNSARLPDVHSLDVRFEKSWYFKKNKLVFYLNIVNLYNHKNIRNYWWDVYRDRTSGQLQADYQDQINIPFFISPGLTFTFD